MPEYLKHVAPLLGSIAHRVMVKPSQKHTGYIGWVGYNNLGDEALYAAIRDLVKPLSLATFSAARESALGRINLSGPRHFQGVLLGGGTIIGPAYILPVQRTLDLGLPMATFGTGVGSTGFGDAERPQLSEWKSILDRFEMVSVRGPRSYAALNNLGVKNVEVIGDPALSLGPAAIPNPKPRPTLAINLAGAPDDQYGIGPCACYREIATIAKRHVVEGGDLLPIALGGRDDVFLRALLNDAGLEKWPVRRLTSAKEFFDCVSGAQWLIGVRLHSAVLATVVGTVPILVAYRDKCWDFMESIGLQPLTVSFHSEAGGIIRKAFEWAQNQPELRNQVFEKVQHWRALQQQYADRIVNRFTAVPRLAHCASSPAVPTSS
jgi:polysaccharide pyruvyl transferase WcaK-like protein